MKNSNLAIVALGAFGLYLVLSSNDKKANAAPALLPQAPDGSGPTALSADALPDLINTIFPTPGAAQVGPVPAPQVIQPEFNPASLPIPPSVTNSETPVVPPPAATAPSQVPDDTAALARLLLADESNGNWKKMRAEVGAWQKVRGLKADNKFGPVTAERMAHEIGALPLVRYWPKGSVQGPAVEAFRDKLEAIAATAEDPRKSQLLAASAREQGQGFQAKPGRPKTIVSL